MTRKRIVGIALLGVVGAAVLATGTLLWTPAAPGAEVQGAVAGRLETVLPVLEELNVNLWRDRATCRYISLTPGGRFQDPAANCGDADPFDARAQAAWDRVAAAVAGAVEGARIDSVLVVGGTVTFIAIPRTMLGRDALLMRWVWRWNSGPAGDPGLPSHWEFNAANEAAV